MGYRAYIGKISKKEHNFIKNMCVDEIYLYKNKDRRQDDYISISSICTTLFEFGKYWEFEIPKEYLSTFFLHDKTEKNWNTEKVLKLATEDVFKFTINFYKTEIQTHLKEIILPFYDITRKPTHSKFLESIQKDDSYPNTNYTFDFTKITQEEQNSLFKMINYMKTIAKEWTFVLGDTELLPFNLNPKVKSITTSSLYEYNIFELIRIYKSFDWNKDLLCYYEH